ncbi:uncharacterized protein LOC126482027 [Schistocerca serialis cubense]|uniref:uncharacterized protein LOC126482027 n=1 Tax=Schistocerca serialis cubense TaxID=2023355 RepID=UPI00214F2E26|nr:uncharacterized protein LOC126482027 [Schistocerca serialis cubense]
MHYCLNAEIYSGKSAVAIPRRVLLPTAVVMRLVEPIKGSNRNVTGDNWFSSVELVNELSNCNLTYIGTMRKNKAELPPSFSTAKGRNVSSSIYGYSGSVTILSHVPKKNKVVNLISTMHHGEYIAGVNAFVLYHGKEDTDDVTRREFLIELGTQLISDCMKRRLDSPFLRKDIRNSICDILGMTPSKASGTSQVHSEAGATKSKRKRCSVCPSKKDRKASRACARCRTPLCLECSTALCPNCFGSLDE